MVRWYEFVVLSHIIELLVACLFVLLCCSLPKNLLFSLWYIILYISYIRVLVYCIGISMIYRMYCDTVLYTCVHPHRTVWYCILVRCTAAVSHCTVKWQLFACIFPCREFHTCTHNSGFDWERSFLFNDRLVRRGLSPVNVASHVEEGSSASRLLPLLHTASQFFLAGTANLIDLSALWGHILCLEIGSLSGRRSLSPSNLLRQLLHILH